jgi:hypothetical protein
MGAFGGKGSWLVLLPILPLILVKRGIDKIRGKLGRCKHPRLTPKPNGSIECSYCGSRIEEPRDD